MSLHHENASFASDPFGRRVGKTIGAATTNYLYDGANPVQELSGGSPAANLLTGLNVDEYFQRTDPNGPANFMTDALGSTIALTDPAGNTLARYTYDPYGNVTMTGSSVNPYLFTGRENDATGLYYCRARYYDPNIGRFVSEDPAGFASGVDFYSYVFSSPLVSTDPMGLSAKDVQRIEDACKKCTKQLTEQGLRYNGTGGLWGWWNNFTTLFTKHEGCWSQATRVQPCLQNPTVPYDNKWTFNVVPVAWGFHHVTEAADSNPSDPNVFCDPWRNTGWTVPKKRAGWGGGGGW